ncbi:ClpXP adapter SpxH family protein [Anaerobacillus sp. MEB173]|uniref:ClpXP adapter SpxH family protein n=1 Tax=Anaerobacillus sp. MEB173 TaxID=3383345 RepID=UPI003F930824
MESTVLHHHRQKPLEIYTFIDPLCPECWALEPFLKKLTLEYGKYFTIRYLVGGKLGTRNNTCQYKEKKPLTPKRLAEIWELTASRTGMSCDGDLWYEDPISTPYSASIALKAAELQGRQAGYRFLRKLRELLFLDKQNITKECVLLACARKAKLDVDEFKKDLYSQGAIKAFQHDIKMTKEMGVEYYPTLVFFNDNVDDEGLKVTGLYDYHVYVQILAELLGYEPEPETILPLESFLQRYNFVATKEISVVYDLTFEQVEIEMKKLQLKQKVTRVPVKYGTFWRYLPQ